MCMFFIEFSSSYKRISMFFFLCVLCVVLIFECIYCGTKFAKDNIPLVFSCSHFYLFMFYTLYIFKSDHELETIVTDSMLFCLFVYNFGLANVMIILIIQIFRVILCLNCRFELSGIRPDPWNQSRVNRLLSVRADEWVLFVYYWFMYL